MTSGAVSGSAPGPETFGRRGEGVTLRIPQELIDQIRAANDIVEIISERVPTKKAGAGYKALCPFHQEKTPSFHINPERQIYYCFGCGAHGSVFQFLMSYDKLEFPEAVAELARRAGIALPSRRGRWEDDDDPIYRANEVATRFFRRRFTSDDGRSAREHWRTRGLSEETADLFRVGFAPPGWDGLMRAAETDGIPPEVLADAGLVVRRERGGFHDRFRNRLVFPLILSGERAVGFGGRALGGEEPKYLNTPETRVYRKGHYLYGLAQTRSAVRADREAILVEGYMDLVSLHQAGFRNVVASAGTALSQEQARILARHADKVFVAYDGDAAGVEAAVRASEVLVELGLKIRVLSLPPESDPDSFVREKGADAMKERLSGALDFIEFLASVRPARTPDDREALARRLVETVSRVSDPLRADLMLEKIAATLSLDKSALVRACAGRREVSGAARRGERPERRAGDGVPAPDAARAAERGILRLLMGGGDAARRARASVSPEDMSDPAARSLLERILEESEPGELVDVAALMDRAGSHGEAALLAEISVLPTADADGARLCDDYVRALTRARIEARVREVDSAIETAELVGNQEELLRLVAERQELAERLKELAVRGTCREAKEARRGE